MKFDNARYLEFDIGQGIGSVYDVLNRPRRYALSLIYLWSTSCRLADLMVIPSFSDYIVEIRTDNHSY